MEKNSHSHHHFQEEYFRAMESALAKSIMGSSSSQKDSLTELRDMRHRVGTGEL